MKSRYPQAQGRTCIDLRLKQVSQIFDSFDPSPFLERDLDERAALYIKSAASEHALRSPLVLRISIAENDGTPSRTPTVVDSIHNHFLYAAELARGDTKALLRRGQINFLLALFILISCVTGAQQIHDVMGGAFFAQVMREGLLILGWVAMWRPVDTFLYSWWPLWESRQLMIKLAKIPIEVSWGRVE